MSEEQKRKIISCNFNIGYMASLPPEEARKYFILQYMVPAAYHIRDNSDKFTDVFLIDQDFTPLIISLMKEEAIQGFIMPFDKHMVYSGNRAVHVFERISDDTLDREKLSEAIKAAFSECMPKKGLADWDFAVIGSMSGNTAKDTFDISILVKSNKNVKRDAILSSLVFSRSGCEKFSQKYDNQVYNSITGKWKHICDPTAVCSACEKNPTIDCRVCKTQKETAAACESCVKLRGSPAATNAYDDPEFN